MVIKKLVRNSIFFILTSRNTLSLIKINSTSWATGADNSSNCVQQIKQFSSQPTQYYYHKKTELKNSENSSVKYILSFLSLLPEMEDQTT